MLALWIVLGIIGFILIVWFGLVLWLFLRVFHRKKSVPFLDIDLTNTHYGPYVEPLYDNIKRMLAREYKDVTIKSFDKTLLHAYYYDNNGSDKTAILVHGYSANPFNNLSVVGNELIEHGYNLLLIVQRGHDKSGGRFITAGAKEQYDLVEWEKWVEENTPSTQIFIYGVSMGCATTSFASDKIKSDKVKCLVLDCGYTVFYEQIKFLLKSRRLPVPIILPIMELYARIFLGVSLKENNATKTLANTKYPCMFVYSMGDETIPYSDIERNYNACQTEKKLYTVEKAGHTASMLASGKDGEKELFEFLDKYIR